MGVYVDLLIYLHREKGSLFLFSAFRRHRNASMSCTYLKKIENITKNGIFSTFTLGPFKALFVIILHLLFTILVILWYTINGMSKYEHKINKYFILVYLLN